MNLTSLSQVRTLLEEIGVKPNSKLGQNFLIDRNILDIIIKMSGIGSNDRVLEVGPGLGILTEALLEKAAFVTAIEKDSGLYRYLMSRFAGAANLSLLHSDALDVDMGGMDFSRFVANLPYCVASRILVELFMLHKPPESITVTVQLEVADRLAAKPSTSEYGLLSVLCQMAYEVDSIRKIAPGCFWPAPGINSGVIHMVRRQGALADVKKKIALRDLVKKAFSLRRKKLSTIFKSLGLPVSLFAESNVNPDSRPEQISPDQWITLAAGTLRNGNCDI
jgi:16S rRNA (adenine1518-N6/adenine1519-N6)-dimethyltransferase